MYVYVHAKCVKLSRSEHAKNKILISMLGQAHAHTNIEHKTNKNNNNKCKFAALKVRELCRASGGGEDYWAGLLWSHRQLLLLLLLLLRCSCCHSHTNTNTQRESKCGQQRE